MTDEPEYNKTDAFLHKHIDPHFWIKLVILTIVLVSGVVVYDYVSDAPENSDLAERLGGAGWELYTSSRCSFCDVQKDVLVSMNGLVVYECDTDVDDNRMCIDNNVTVVPTWINVESGEVIQGMQTVEQLEAMIDFVFMVRGNDDE